MPSSKSTSNWLDRLRSSKGFPVSDLDLDHFLSSNPNPNPNPPNKPQHDDHYLVNLMSNVLSDLFVIGNPQKPLPNPKTSRKQPNPRNHTPSADGAVSPSSADNSVADDRKLVMPKSKPKKKKKKRESCGSADSDLSGFSRTEVTVIDTSSPGWRSERIVFRKGTVWKAREKKARIFGRKKRKVGLVAKTGSDKEKPVPAAAVEALTVTHEETDLEDTDNQILRPRRLSKLSRSPHVPADHPSTFGHEAVSTSKKNGASDPESALKAN